LDNYLSSLLLVGRVIDTYTLAHFQSYIARQAETVDGASSDPRFFA
jgi:hypothetical protein